MQETMTEKLLKKQITVLRSALDMAMASASEATVQRQYFEQLKAGWKAERTKLLAEIKKLKGTGRKRKSPSPDELNLNTLA